MSQIEREKIMNLREQGEITEKSKQSLQEMMYEVIHSDLPNQTQQYLINMLRNEVHSI